MYSIGCVYYYTKNIHQIYLMGSAGNNSCYIYDLVTQTYSSLSDVPVKNTTKRGVTDGHCVALCVFNKDSFSYKYSYIVSTGGPSHLCVYQINGSNKSKNQQWIVGEKLNEEWLSYKRQKEDPVIIDFGSGSQMCVNSLSGDRICITGIIIFYIFFYALNTKP